MFKIWSIIILALTMLFAGIAVLSIERRGATPEQLVYTGDWICADGSGERANIVYMDKSYRLRVNGAGGNTLVSCESGKLRDGNVVFNNTPDDSLGALEPCAYVTIQMSGSTLIINGYSAAPRVFQRVPGSEPQDSAY